MAILKVPALVRPFQNLSTLNVRVDDHGSVVAGGKWVLLSKVSNKLPGASLYACTLLYILLHSFFIKLN